MGFDCSQGSVSGDVSDSFGLMRHSHHCVPWRESICTIGPPPSTRDAGTSSWTTKVDIAFLYYSTRQRLREMAFDSFSLIHHPHHRVPSRDGDLHSLTRTTNIKCRNKQHHTRYHAYIRPLQTRVPPHALFSTSSILSRLKTTPKLQLLAMNADISEAQKERENLTSLHHVFKGNTAH